MRTTEEAVKLIIEVEEDAVLAPFLEVATSLVDQVAAVGVLADARLELIERWLAAHFYTVRSPRATAEKAGPVGENFQSKVDLGLFTSHYGQQAVLLDTTGTLASINNQSKTGKTKASVTWLGKARCR